MPNPSILRGSGSDAERHINKYVLPVISAKGQLRLEQPFLDIPVGTHFTPISVEQDSKGVFHTVGLFEDLRCISIPNTKIYREVTGGKHTSGFDYEKHQQRMFFDHGLSTTKETAGASAKANDVIIDHEGTIIHCEAKVNLKGAKLGAISVVQDGTSWKFTDNACYADKLKTFWENYEVDGLKLLDYLNVKRPSKDYIRGKTKFKSLTIRVDSYLPAHYYLLDKKVDILTIKDYGAYRCGLSHEVDRFGLGLPTIEKLVGSIKFEEDRPFAPIQLLFKPRLRKSLDKSHINFMLTEDVLYLKRKLQDYAKNTHTRDTQSRY